MTPSPYRPISRVTTTNPIGFNNTNDARKVSANQRQLIQGQGDALMQSAEDLGNQYRDQTQGVEDYLHPLYDPMAQGQGGYNQAESAAINFSPQDAQNLVTSAGVTAGNRTAADVAAAERAANAAGGNPMALATYRERATRAGAGAGADAMTQARVQAKGLESQGAQATGNARLGQQGQALNYYGQLQGQKNANAQNEQALQQGAFGTQTSGTNAATGDTLKASQTPSTMDKIVGGVTGVLSKLADGQPGYLDDGGTDAVVGEDGPEAIVERASAQPYLENGFPPAPDIGAAPMTPVQIAPQLPTPPGAMSQFLSRFRQTQGAQQQPQQEAWNPTTPYQQTGQVIGSALGAMMPKKTAADGKAPERDPAPRYGQPQFIGPPKPQYQDSLERSMKRVPLQENLSLRRIPLRENLSLRRIPLRDNIERSTGSVPYQGRLMDSVEKTYEPMKRGVEPSTVKPDLLEPQMADGRMSAPRPMHPYGAPRIGRADANPPHTPKIITSPTHVRLAPGDAVVPLTHRPKAKVRPSTFVNAYRSARG